MQPTEGCWCGCGGGGEEAGGLWAEVRAITLAVVGVEAGVPMRCCEVESHWWRSVYPRKPLLRVVETTELSAVERSGRAPPRRSRRDSREDGRRR